MSTFLFLLGFTTVQCLSWFLKFALRGGEWWVIFIFCLSCSRVDSSEDANHRHRVKGGKWRCLSQVISSSLLLPHELKTETQKGVFWIFKGSTWLIYLERQRNTTCRKLWWTLWKVFGSGFWMHEKHSLSVQGFTLARLSKHQSWEIQASIYSKSINHAL